MKINFDYYRNLEKVDLFLCNPDGRELFVIPGRNRRIHLRFNDLSELTFDVDAVTTLSDHKIINLEAYDYIQTKRLIYATGIGWFQIEHVDEYDDGVTKYKTVTAESGQAVFKNKGFISEERVYCFYNPADPYDDFYDSSDDSAIPSVMGQWSKQLGIKQALGPDRTEPSKAFEDWTVTYIDPGLTYQGETGVCRTFDENVTYGYDWIANTVSSAFEVVVLFDFLYKTIHVLRPDKATQKTNVIYTFNNFMRQVNVTENAEDIVTVLNCNGSNCDITAVNPTGTNYICDFSYFMDTVNYRWMSAALIAKLNQWYADCEAEKDSYTNMVQLLRTSYINQTSCKTQLQDASLRLQDLKNAQSKRYIVGDGDPGTLCGTVCAETVAVGQFSLDVNSSYSNTSFNGDHVLTVYQTSPDYDANNGVWIFSGASTTDTANNIISSNLSDGNTSGISYWYFTDVSDGSSYCRLKAASSVNRESASSTQYCCGFERYIAYTHPRLNAVTGSTEYTDSVQRWINLYEETVGALSAESKRLDNVIDLESHHLHSISSRLNIISYFSNTPDLLRELNCYWIEGDYTNDNIAVLDTTTPAEEIDLANELMSSGYIELRKMCQPRFSFSLDSIDAAKIPEFASQMRMLDLGKIITIEKDEGLWYYPALLSIEMDLDHTDDFRMEFANALRLDDWGYTYADLIASAASTSRKISANWQDLSSYAKDKDTISSLIQDPLDATLRASFANMVNQEFVIDKTGILGRKFESEGSDIFEKEQVRLINNLLIFTDDGWQTAKTALGKIYYTDEKGNNVTSYGLIAETLIGSVIIGETVKVRNENNSVLINEDGITIKRLVEKGTTPIIAEQKFTFNSSAQSYLSETLNIVEGATYVVVWDGVEYICECKSGTYESDPILYIGNERVIGKEDDGIPFFLGRINVSGGISFIACLEPNTTHTAALYLYAVTVFQATTGGTLMISSYVPESVFAGYQEVVSSSFKTHNAAITDLGSQLIIAKNSINAKVSAKYLNQEKSFGWELLSDRFIVYSASSSGGSATVLLENALVDLFVWFDVSFQVVVGQQYAVTYNDQEYLCTARLITDQPYVNLGNTSSFDNEDADKPFRIAYDKSTKKLLVLPIKDNNIRTVSLGISIPGSGTGSIKQVLTVDESGLQVEGIIYATSGTLENLYINGKLYFSADPSKDYFIDGSAMSSLGTDERYYINMPGFKVSTKQAYFSGELIAASGTFSGELKAASGTFSGELQAASGTFSGRLQAGTKGYPFIISSSNAVEDSPCIYSMYPLYAGSGGFGSAQNNCVYIGGDGFSYWFNDGKHDYNTAIRPGYILCSGDNGYQGINHKATAYTPGGIIFCYGGITNLRGSDIPSSPELVVGSMEISKTNVLMGGNFTGRSSGSIVSDSARKHDILTMDSQYDILFDALRPVTYKYNDGTSGRTHTGFIAQDVVSAIQLASLTTMDFAAYIEATDVDGSSVCGLRYEEFVSLNTWQIQKLKARVAELERIVATLQGV